MDLAGKHQKENCRSLCLPSPRVSHLNVCGREAQAGEVQKLRGGRKDLGVV